MICIFCLCLIILIGDVSEQYCQTHMCFWCVTYAVAIAMLMFLGYMFYNNILNFYLIIIALLIGAAMYFLWFIDHNECVLPNYARKTNPILTKIVADELTKMENEGQDVGKWFFGLGTLIGLLRNQDFIPWEHDSDIHIEKFNPEFITKIFTRIKNNPLYDKHQLIHLDVRRFAMKNIFYDGQYGRHYVEFWGLKGYDQEVITCGMPKYNITGYCPKYLSSYFSIMDDYPEVPDVSFIDFFIRYRCRHL